MKLGIVILSRYSSSRLPGKVLLPIAGKPLLAHITDRLQRLPATFPLIVATSDAASDDPIADFCRQRDLPCYRGSLTDVAGRFLAAAREQDWDYAVRINGDNLFIDLEAFEEMAGRALSGQYDFISNVPERSFPYGMSIEMVQVDFFQKIYEQLTDERYREHVTLYLYEHPDIGRRYYHYNTHYPALSGKRLAVDTAADLIRTERLVQQLGAAWERYTLKDLAALANNI